ncbi:MAG: hypothetical protein ACR2JQ_10390 [Mycobacteriales bacterium]
MSMASGPEGHELDVADTGSQAEQLTRPGVSPGTHLRVVAESPPDVEGTVGGRLAGWPDLTWEDFQRASRLAQADLDRW